MKMTGVTPRELGTAISPEGGLNLLDPSAELGWQGLQFYLRIGTQRLTARSGEGQANSDRGIHWLADLAEGLSARLSAAPSPAGNGWVVTPVLCNRRRQEVSFDGYGFAPAPNAAGPIHPELGRGSPGLLVYGHMNNLRYERLPHCRVTYPFLRPLPTCEEQIGQPGCSSIPLLLLGVSHGQLWLAEGAFTERRHLLTWHLDLPRERGRLLSYSSEFVWTGGGRETAPPGGETVLESIFFCAFSSPPDGVYRLYMDELAQSQRFSGPQRRLDREPLYCTWHFFT